MRGLILGLLHPGALAVSLPDTCHYHSSPSPFPSLAAPPVMSILIFPCHSKLVNQTFESKLSAGYLHAAPRQKCRFEEAAICRREGSSCSTIRGNLKSGGRWEKDDTNPKSRGFCCCCKHKNDVLLHTSRSHGENTACPLGHCHQMPPLCSQMSLQSWAVVSCPEQRVHPTRFHPPAFWEKENSLKFIQFQPLSPLGAQKGRTPWVSAFLARKTQQEWDESLWNLWNGGSGWGEGRALGWLHVQDPGLHLPSPFGAATLHIHGDQLLPSLISKGSRQKNKSNFFFFLQFSAILINCDKTWRIFSRCQLLKGQRCHSAIKGTAPAAPGDTAEQGAQCCSTRSMK